MLELQIVNNSLEEIKKANLLPPEKMQIVNDLLPELKHNFNTSTVWRTETEIKYSVLQNKMFPDKASKYHQAKTEQMVFFEQLMQLSFNYRKTQGEIVIKEAEIEELEDILTNLELKPWQIKKIEAQIGIKSLEKQELAFKLEYMQKQGVDRVRELEIWSKIKTELDDSSFDKDSKDSNQLLSLTKRYAIEAYNVLHIAGQSVDIGATNNILGQFETMMLACIEKGIVSYVIDHFGETSPIGSWLMQSFNLQKKDQ
ncbi:hypothetical protein [Geosporobacter ferrireducens]|uniref:Uncharacterized protein n=1 Tax=Geosporobacter ferrireducens TaxID=1424294 RepID=A0A1D8GIF4_9FIRM|nr:hypothetical protein [Geosporobacter ferrireducens]AOT70681.1 hypothetical protein Gferi_14525 [Geosporobacter ferrireducens]